MSAVFLPKIRATIIERQNNILTNQKIAAELQVKIDALNRSADELKSTALANYKISIEQALKTASLEREHNLQNVKHSIDNMAEHSQRKIAAFLAENEQNIKFNAAKIVDMVAAKILGNSGTKNKIN